MLVIVQFINAYMEKFQDTNQLKKRKNLICVHFQVSVISDNLLLFFLPPFALHFAACSRGLSLSTKTSKVHDDLNLTFYVQGFGFQNLGWRTISNV